MPVRKVKLSPAQLMQVFQSLLRTHTSGNRKLERPVDLAENKVGGIINLKTALDGDMTWELPKVAAEYEWSREEILGVKTALVQAITGVQGSFSGAPHGRVKYELRPLAAAFGIERLVAKEAGLDVEADTEAALEFDDELAAREGVKGDLPATAPAKP